jgi:hypothetical protein
VDVCGTIAKYFVGVNIPKESVGSVIANTDNPIEKLKIVKSNAVQIKTLAGDVLLCFADSL